MAEKRTRIIFPKNGYNAFSRFKPYIDNIIVMLDSYNNDTDINDILELYNVLEFIINLKEDDCTEKERILYKSNVSLINSIIGKYFSNIKKENLFYVVGRVENKYIADFWQIISNYKKETEIDSKYFLIYLNNNPHHTKTILTIESIAKNFSETIYIHMLSAPRNIAEIISFLFAKKETTSLKLYVRGVFTPKQFNFLFKTYIDSDDPNINMLKLIRISPNDKELGIDDMIRLLASRREVEEGKKLSEKGVVIKHSYGVSFRDIDEPKILTEEDECVMFIYDRNWILNNLDYATLLNNFIYLLEYVDLQFRSSFPKPLNHNTPLTDIFLVKGKTAYNNDSLFGTYTGIHSLQMQAYIGELKNNGVDIENIFQWFFEEYLKNEFSITGFTYNPPSQNTSYLERCKNIATEMEAVLKQYRLYCEYGSIDPELFIMSSEHIIYSEISSMQPSKYLYGNSERLKICIQYLFSENFLFYFRDESTEGYKCLYDYICNAPVTTKDFFINGNQEDALNSLLDIGAIIEKENSLKIDKKTAIILRNIYEKGVLCYCYCKNYKSTIERLIKSKDIVSGATLFSKPEYQYIDYILNKATYSDGLDLRNKYVHGTVVKNDEKNFQHYIEFLKIMVLIIIKINEEFCLKFPL